MRILKRSKEVRALLNASIQAYRNGIEKCHYVYLHRLNGEVYYVGMGTHDRAVRVFGRSKRWYQEVTLDQVTVEVVTPLLNKDDAEQLERYYVGLHKDTCINEQLKQYSDTVMCFERDGTFVKEYDILRGLSIGSFKSRNVLLCCEGKRGLHANMVWMYKSDYEANGFHHKTASNHSKEIEQVTPDSEIVRTLLTAQSFEQFGFSPKNIQKVCTGAQKTHMGYVFRYK